MKKKMTNIAIVLLLFVLVLIVFKVNRIKLYRSGGSLLFVQTKKASEIYDDAETIVVKDLFGNYIITKVFKSNGDGTYLTKRENSHYVDNFKSDSKNIVGLYSFQLKHFFSFFESKITRFFFMLLAIAIVLKIRGMYIRKQQKIEKIRNYNYNTKEPLR